MDFSKYTTQELEFITSNIEFLKKELEKRHIKELDDFPFKSGDVIRSKRGDDNFLFKINEIDKRNNSVFADAIEIIDGGLFNYLVYEWFDIDHFYNYVKIEDSEIFEKLRKIIDKYNDEAQQLNDDAYIKLKNEIATYDYNV